MGTLRSTAAALLLLAAATAGSPAAAQLWEVDNRLLGYSQGPHVLDQFGIGLAAGDFDGDGFDDLAVGAPGSAAVELFRGGPGGLPATAWTSWALPQLFPGFGFALAAGDFDGDGRDELAVGSPTRNQGSGDATIYAAGAVHVLEREGGTWQLTGSFVQGAASGLPDAAEANDRFGTVLAVGDFDGSGHDDLAIGVPSEGIGSVDQAGAVFVLLGSASGLAAAGSQVFHRDGGGMSGVAEEDALLGAALAAGDFDSDGVDDLAIGAPREAGGVGEVIVLFGVDGFGLASTGEQRFDPADVGEVPANQRFGEALAAGDFNPSLACAIFGTCADDLAIGAPGQVVSWSGGSVAGAGRVYLLHGSDGVGLVTTSIDAIDQGELDPNSLTAPEQFDGFGAALAAGALDRRSGVDLVVGSPNEAFENVGAAGGAHALFGPPPLTDRPWQFLFARPGLATAPAALDDDFGAAFAIGDFDGDGTGDLATGLPGRTRAGQANAGVVQVLYGALFADGFERGDPGAWAVD